MGCSFSCELFPEDVSGLMTKTSFDNDVGLRLARVLSPIEELVDARCGEADETNIYFSHK